jgi:hypothetical protein
MGLKELALKNMEEIHLAQDGVQWRPLVNMAMTSLVPYNSDTLLTSLTTKMFRD